MLWDFIVFGILTGGYLMLSLSKTLERHKSKIKQAQREQMAPGENQIMFSDTKKPANHHHNHNHNHNHHHKESVRATPTFELKPYIKKIINYSVSFNSSFLIVGSMSESYFYSITMVGNIISVTLGFVYAFLIVHPFMYSLDAEIKTPYQYFEKRYHNKLVRSISAVMGMFFYFSFITLYLWGCTILLCTLIPDMPFWLANLVIGAYSLIGSSIGGFQQTTLINATQFLTVIAGLITAMVLTVTKSRNSLEEMWNFASLNERTDFFETKTNIKIRYTLLNQLISLPMPWCAVHSLLLPNFIRYRSIEGKLKSRFFMVSNFPIMAMVNFLILLSGGVLCYLFFYGCDPFRAEKIGNKNQTGTYWLYLILSEYAPALSGVLFSSIICYSIVQHSSGMSLCANTLVEEAIKPLVTCINLSEYACKRIKLALTVLLGVLSILYSMSFQFAKNTMLSLFFIFNNTTNSPILGLFLLSAFNPYANSFGAITGFVTNLLLNYWYASGSLLISKELPTDTTLCNANTYLSNYENFDFSNVTHLTASVIAQVNDTSVHDHYFNNFPVIYYIFSIPAIWYCIFSVCVTFSLGSIFSLVYSLVTTGTFDADSAYSEERKKYLYFYKIYSTRKKMAMRVRV